MNAPLRAPPATAPSSSWIRFDPAEFWLDRAVIIKTTSTERYEEWTQESRRALVMIRDGIYYMLAIESDHAELAMTSPAWIEPETFDRMAGVRAADRCAGREDRLEDDRTESAETRGTHPWDAIHDRNATH